jgi:hypothetical protein
MKRIFLTLVMIAAGINFTVAQCTIKLISAAETDDQTVCINTPITDIVYSVTGTSNVVSVSLPDSVSGSFDEINKKFTISGTPSQSGTFNYTVILAGCLDAVATGTIKVIPNTTMTLTSATGTDNQTSCFNTTIETITYSTTGATGADFDGLPVGVTGNWANNTVTISGTPSQSGTFNYTATTTGSACGTATKTGTITVHSEFKFTTQPHNSETICYDAIPAPLEVTVTGGSTPYHYFWQESSTGTDPWKNATNGDDNSTYQPPRLKETTFYRCNVTSGANCGTIFSNNCKITVLDASSVEFTKLPPGPACANQQGLIYAVELVNNTTYLWSVEHGEITENIAENEKMIKWDKVTTATTGVITIEIRNTISGCTYTKQQNVTISADVAPDANDIVVKSDKDEKAYMLIYPNPSGAFHYQWYKNDMAIDNATEQFYYPPNFNQILEKDSSYKVYVAEQSSASCGNFSKPITINDLPPQNTFYFSVVPNPNRGSFSIIFNQKFIENQQSEMLVQITLPSGEIIWEQKIKGTDNVYINQALSAGIYIVTITTSDKRIFSKVTIVQ